MLPPVNGFSVGVSMLAGCCCTATVCGTAAVVSPIGELCYRGEKAVVNGGKIGPVTQHLYDTLTGIQWGRIPDPYGWVYPIPRR